jgi:hypothetical protein
MIGLQKNKDPFLLRCQITNACTNVSRLARIVTITFRSALPLSLIFNIFQNHTLLPAALLATAAATANGSTTSRSSRTAQLGKLVLAHRPLPLPPQLRDGQILLGHRGVQLLHLLGQSRHLPLVVRRVAAGVAVQGPGQAEGGARVPLHLDPVPAAPHQLGRGLAGLLLGEGGPPLRFGRVGQGGVALGPEGRALGPEAGLGLDAAGGRPGVGLGGLDGPEEVLKEGDMQKCTGAVDGMGLGCACTYKRNESERGG